MRVLQSRKRRFIQGALFIASALATLVYPSITVLAQSPWGDGYDTYPLNSQLHGVGGWKGWDNNPAFGALVSNVESRSAPHSVSITGGSDLVHEYSGHTSGQWVYTAWQYIPAAYSGEGYFILLNTYNDGGAKSWSVQVHFRASTDRVISDFDGSWLPLVRGRWVELRVEIDLDSDLQTFYYDDQALYSNKSWSTGVSGSGATAIEAVDLYANSSSPIYFDDLSLKSASATSLASSATPSEFGDDVLLTASVTSLSTVAAQVTGTVEFFEGAVSLGTSPVLAGGQASLNLSGLALGAHNFSAVYSGDANYAPSSGAMVQNVNDTVPPRVSNVNSNADTGDGALSQGEGTRVQITQLLPTFSEAVLDPAGDADPDDVTNPSNYSLLLDPTGAAIAISIDGVSYNAGSRTATVDINAGAPLGPGSYRFSVHGTPSIQDSVGNPLDGDGDGIGGDNYVLDFNVLTNRIPDTGFRAGTRTQLPLQLEHAEADGTGMQLIVPKLDASVEIVGIPFSAGEWDVSWLGDSVGYLAGTAFPTWTGNTVLTGQVVLKSGLPGPFRNLDQLVFGDHVNIQAWGKTFTYFVTQKAVLPPDALQAFKHSDLDMLTLITCSGFDPSTSEYSLRTVAQAVLISISAE